MKLDFLSEGQPSVNHNSRFGTSTRHVGHAHGRTEVEPCGDAWILCSFIWFFLMKSVESTTGETESRPEWQNLRGNLRQRTTIMYQKYGHWTVTGSVFGHLMRNRDDLRIIVK